MTGLSIVLMTLVLVGALLSWLVAAWSVVGIWRNRGDVGSLELAGSFMTAIRKLPPEAGPYVDRFRKAFVSFFLFVVVGALAGVIAAR
jgi:hypothetical protein